MKTNRKANSVRDLLTLYQLNMAVHRNINLESVFHFVGLDGIIYTTNDLGANEFRLTETEFLGSFNNLHEMEIYEIGWLAFDNQPWENNQILMINGNHISGSIVVYDNHLKMVMIEYNRIMPEFIRNLYHVRTSDIWIYHNYEEEGSLDISRRLKVNLLLDDNSIHTGNLYYITEFQSEILPRVKAWQPITRYKAPEPNGNPLGISIAPSYV